MVCGCMSINQYSVSVIFFTVNIKFIDAVVRTSYYKYFHPKEALIANGVLNR